MPFDGQLSSDAYTGYTGFGGTNPDAPTPDGGGAGGGSDWISAIINLGAQIYASEVARSNTKKTIKAQKDAAELAWQRELEMWYKQNAYNDPSAQMQRLLNAGLNPNLMYGNGSASTGNSSSLPRYNAPNLQYNYKPIDIPAVLSGFQDFRLRQAQINNVEAQTANTRARTINENITGAILKMKEWDKDQETSAKGHNQWHDRMYRGQAEAADVMGDRAQAALKSEWQRIMLMSQDEQLKMLQQNQMQKHMTATDLENEKRRAQVIYERQKAEWAKSGVTSGDHVLLRILVRMMNESGVAFD